MEKKTKAGLRHTSEKNSENEQSETFGDNSLGKTAVKKAKLSLQKQDGKIVSRASTSTALGLNDTCDFKDDKIFDKILRKNKSKSKSARIKKVKQCAEKSGDSVKRSRPREKAEDEDVSKSIRKNVETEPTYLHERKASAAEQVAPAAPKMRRCPTCELDLHQEEFHNHIKDCLQKFSRALQDRRKKEPDRHATENTGEFCQNNANNPELEGQVKTPSNEASESIKSKDGGQCPSQQEGFPTPPKIRHCPTCELNLLEEEFQNHIKDCLQKFSRAIQDRREKDNALIADKVKINEKRKQEIGDELPPMDDLAGEDYFLCQICQKDLSHMNSQRRTQHVNRCIDQMETSDSKASGDGRVLQSSESAVLDCPMCGKALKTQASRKAHLKTCARALRVASDQLVQIVKLQEAEHKNNLKTGNPQTHRTDQVKKVSRNKQASRTTQRSKMSRMPLDEETQLAMALSSSLADKHKKQEQAQLNQLNLRGITDTCLQPQTGESKKRRKKKNAQQVSKPPLLQLTKLEAQNRIAERVAQLIVCQQSTDDVLSTPPSNNSGLFDLPGTKLLVPSKENSLSTGMLWQRTSLSDRDRDLDRLSLFYTKSLMPPVSMAQVKTSQRNRINIAGRRKSAELDQTEMPVCHEGDSIASTQTAIVLAELAADAECESDELSGSGIQASVHLAEDEPLTTTADSKLGYRGADASGTVSAQDPGREEIAVTAIGADEGQMEVDPHQVNSEETTSKVFWAKDLLHFVQDEDELKEASGFCPEDAAEPREEEEQQRVLLCLQRQYLELIDNPSFSDLELKPNDGSTVHTHRLILSVRCPKLTQLPVDSIGHVLLDAPREAVLCVMRFVYGGVTSVENSCVEDVLSLAKRFDLKDLVIFCKKHMNQCSIREAATQQAAAAAAEAEEGRERRSSIDLLLTEMFSDSDEPQGRQLEEDVFKKPSPVELSDEDEDEWREIYCSQRQQLQRTKSLEIGQGDAEETSSSLENCEDIVEENTIAPEEKNEDGTENCDSDKVALNRSGQDDFEAPEGNLLARNCDQFDLHKEMNVSSLRKKCELERGGGEIDEAGRSDGSSSGEHCGEEELFSDDELLELALVSADACSDAEAAAGCRHDSSGNNDIEINTGSSSSEDRARKASGPMLEESGGDESCLSESRRNDPSKTRTEGNSPVEDANKFEKTDHGKRKRTFTDDYKSPLVAKCLEQSRFESTGEVTPEVRRDKRMKMSTPLDGSYSSGKSVVQEDSLYITPIPKQCQRSTFILITPATSRFNETSKDKDVYSATPVGKIVMDSYGNERVVKFPADADCSYLEDDHQMEWKESSQKGTDSDCQLQVPVVSDVSCIPPSEKSDLVDHSVHNESNTRKVRDTDSDVEITGDNFNELSKSQVASPKFSSKANLKKISCKDSEKRKGFDESLSSIVEKSKTDPECDKSWQSDVQVQEEPSAKSDDNSNNNYEPMDDFPADDVWDGFDELNAACDAEAYCDADTEESPQKRSVSPLSQKQRPPRPRASSESTSSGKPVKNTDLASDDGDLPSPGRDVQEEEFDVPSADSFMWDEANDPSLETSIVRDEQQKGNETFKTPVVQVSRKVIRKLAPPPSPFSPMPDYDAMNTPQLKNAVTQFGVRPVGKKRMKKLLADIYHQTHQYETDSDYEADQRSPQKLSTSPSKTLSSNRVSSKSSSVSTKPSSKSSKASSVSGKSGKAPSSTSAGKQHGKSLQQKTGPISSKSAGQVSAGMSSEAVSSDEASSQRSVSSSQDSSTSEMPEETFMGVDEEDIPCSQQASQADLPSRLQKFILQRPDIHTKVLIYEPLELDWLKKEIQEAGIKCSMQKLMDFLDEKCVTFTMKKMSNRNTNRRARGRKKKINVPAENV